MTADDRADSAPVLKVPAPIGSGVLCVVGNLDMDLVLTQVTAPPKWGRETVAAEHSESVGGQGANCGLAAAALGVSSRILSCVGQDGRGEQIVARLAAGGVDVRGVAQVAEERTAVTVALVREDGERCFISDFAANRHLTLEFVRERWAAVTSANVLAVVGVFNLPGVTLGEVAELLREARKLDIVTLLDPGWDPGGWTRGVRADLRAALSETDLFVPNRDEALATTGARDEERSLAILARWCAGTVVMKNGPLGSAAMVGGRVVTVPAIGGRVVSTVGAGDVYDAGLIAGYLDSGNVRDGMTSGTIAAHLYLTGERDTFPTAAAITRWGREVARAQDRAGKPVTGEALHGDRGALMHRSGHGEGPARDGEGRQGVRAGAVTLDAIGNGGFEGG